MAMPSAFRYLARIQARGPLADKEGTPIRMDGKVVSHAPDGSVLRAIVGEATVEIEGNYFQRRTAAFHLRDLPRLPRRGDVLWIDGAEAHVETSRPNRVGMVDCILAD